MIQENEVYVIVFEGSSSAGTAPIPAALCPQLPSTLNENGIAAAPQQKKRTLEVIGEQIN